MYLQAVVGYKVEQIGIIIRLKSAKYNLHIQFTRHVNKNQYFRNNENVIFIGY